MSSLTTRDLVLVAFRDAIKNKARVNLRHLPYIFCSSQTTTSMEDFPTQLTWPDNLISESCYIAKENIKKTVYIVSKKTNYLWYQISETNLVHQNCNKCIWQRDIRIQIWHFHMLMNNPHCNRNINDRRRWIKSMWSIPANKSMSSIKRPNRTWPKNVTYLSWSALSELNGIIAEVKESCMDLFMFELIILFIIQTEI